MKIKYTTKDGHHIHLEYLTYDASNPEVCFASTFTYDGNGRSIRVFYDLDGKSVSFYFITKIIGLNILYKRNKHTEFENMFKDLDIIDFFKVNYHTALNIMESLQ